MSTERTRRLKTADRSMDATTDNQHDFDADAEAETFAIPENWAAKGGRERGKGPQYYAASITFSPRPIRGRKPVRPGSEFEYAGDLEVRYVDPETGDVVTQAYEAVQHGRDGQVLPSCLWGRGLESFLVVISPSRLARGGDQSATARELALVDRRYDVEVTADV